MESDWLDLRFGWIYATGRWYVGRTVCRFWLQHCAQAKRDKRLTDVLHTTMANELSPFSFVVFPREEIAKDSHANTREETNAKFRHFATPRERYWVRKVRSLWPHGLNSECPRKPAGAWVKRVWRASQHDRLEINEDEVNGIARHVSAWLHRMRNEGDNALNELKNWDKAKLRETLERNECSSS